MQTATLRRSGAKVLRLHREKDDDVDDLHQQAMALQQLRKCPWWLWWLWPVIWPLIWSWVWQLLWPWLWQFAAASMNH